MLERAARLAGGGLRFARGDIAGFGSGETAGRWDLVFSNAALQCVPDHSRLLERQSATLTAGGQLPVQVPDNHDHVSHLVAASSPPRSRSAA
jgi:trans-aconitate 2-methyltransferase